MNLIHIIYTGGTIGGMREDIDKPVKSRTTVNDFEMVLRERLPSWTKKVEWKIKSPFCKLSEDFIPDDWNNLAESAHEGIQAGAKGIVIAHGTDTLTYSAAALSMMLQNPPVPIIFTGSNNPLFTTHDKKIDPETDIFQNMSHALLLASKTKMRGVFVSFSGASNGRSLILPGTRVKKEAYRTDRFQPVFGEPPIGEINNTPEIVINQSALSKIKSKTIEGKYRCCLGVNSSVAYFTLYPGFMPHLIDFAIKQGIKGIIIGGYGTGTICSKDSYSIITSVKKAVNQRIPVFITSQHYGMVSLKAYGSSDELKQAGAIGLKYMTSEAALAKLMWVLSQESEFDNILKLMKTPIAGEILESTLESCIKPMLMAEGRVSRQ
ncbi:L-asparaginase [Candidatus Magnetomoraceae bacterium gMMP-15]